MTCCCCKCVEDGYDCGDWRLLTCSCCYCGLEECLDYEAYDSYCNAQQRLYEAAFETSDGSPPQEGGSLLFILWTEYCVCEDTKTFRERRRVRRGKSPLEAEVPKSTETTTTPAEVTVEVHTMERDGKV